MKYVIIIGDGMADYKIESIGNKTPLMVAKKPRMDYMASHGVIGYSHNVPEGMVPESDTANLAVMGYDPKIYSKGRSPLEALSMGIEMQPDETAFRINTVALTENDCDYEHQVIIDHGADEIPTEESAELIKTLDKELGDENRKYYPGVSYRHCLVVANGTTQLGNMTPPHDISGRVIGEYLSREKNAQPLIDLMKKSYEILKDHPVNIERRKKGLHEANSIWLWGEGRRPQLENFKEKNGVSGCVVSAVDLLKGIGICAGMETPEVEGATGYIDTNFEGKTQAGIDAFKRGTDLVYLHFEAPDECGHRGEAQNKVKAIEMIDSRVLTKMLEYLNGCGDDYRILIMPDHPTPLETMTHSSAPVPFLIYDSRKKENGVSSFTEKNAAETGEFVEHGPDIMSMLLEK